ncbi:MAG: hypothetical protein JST51_09350 [Armatimonadetes bacterium]|nr:hypothetical protein [Armatimonadota bacterium]
MILSRVFTRVGFGLGLLLLAGSSMAAPALLSDIASAARLQEIAQLLAAKQGTPALLTEALQICGFTIRKEDHTLVAKPFGTDNDLHLAVTDYEIRGFIDLYNRGQGMTLGNFVASMDYQLKQGGYNDSCGTDIKSFLIYDPVARQEVLKPGDPNPNRYMNQAVSGFLTDLAQNHENFDDMNFGDSAKLDPIQSLILTRIVTQEIATAIKKSSPAGLNLFASNYSPYADDAGWAEDGWVGGITGLINKLVESKIGEKLAKPMDKANSISSISKFILTYTFLKTELKVEGENNLLVRTKDTSAGEKKTLTARIFIDGSKVTDWMKENRATVAMAGLDVDMPKSGGLAGIETSWEISGDGKYYDFNNHKVQWASGQGDMSKVKTDANGVAKGILEGTAQQKALDPKTVKAYEKSISVKVTPQAKATDMKQDVIDAVTGAIGISGGASGWISPVMETLYRMKWFGSETVNVRVRDWKQAQSIGHITVTVKGDGNFFSRDRNLVQHIDRVLDVTDMVMDINDPVGEVPQQVLDGIKNLPEAQRKQMEALIKQQQALGGDRYFQLKGPGHVRYTVRDSGTSYIDNSDCLVDRFQIHETDAGNNEFDFPSSTPEGKYFNMVIKKLKGENENGIFVVNAILNATHTEQRTKGKPSKPGQIPVELLDNCHIDKSYMDSGLKITLKPGAQLPGEEGTGFYGVTTIPFKFGENDQFSGKITISIAIQNKVEKPK